MKESQLGEFEELVLLIVGVLKDEAYGVSIHEKMRHELNKKVNISAIHVVLKRLENKGFLNSEFGGITKERGGRRKKFYSLTSAGDAVLTKQYDLRTRLFAQI